MLTARQGLGTLCKIRPLAQRFFFSCGLDAPNMHPRPDALDREIFPMNPLKWLGVAAAGLVILLLLVFFAVRVGTMEAPLDAYVKGNGFQQCAMLAVQLQGISSRWVVVTFTVGLLAVATSGLGGYLSKETFVIEWLKPLPVVLALSGAILTWFGTQVASRADKAGQAAATCTRALALANDKNKSDADAYQECVLAKADWLASRAQQLLPSISPASSAATVTGSSAPQ